MTGNQEYCGFQVKLQTKNDSLPKTERTDYLLYYMINKHILGSLFLLL